MGKSSPSPPAAPDPVATANAQGAINKETAVTQAELNFVNQKNAGGELTYNSIGESDAGNPRYEAVYNLSPDQQKLYDLQVQAGAKYGETANNQLDMVSSLLSQPINFENRLGAIPTFNEGTRDEVRQSMLDRFQPQFQQDRERLETKLTNQGITAGSEAWRRGIDDFNRSETDFRLAADSQSLGQAGQLYGMEQQAYNTAANNLVNERQIPLNELNAMMTGTQVQSPDFINPAQTQVAPADLLGATYASANLKNQNYMAQMQSNSAATSGLYGLLGSGAMAAGMYFSDRRLKRDITQIGVLGCGLPVYAFRYLWDDTFHTGVMSDEVRELIPGAVFRLGLYDVVDYRRIN